MPRSCLEYFSVCIPSMISKVQVWGWPRCNASSANMEAGSGPSPNLMRGRCSALQSEIWPVRRKPPLHWYTRNGGIKIINSLRYFPLECGFEPALAENSGKVRQFWRSCPTNYCVDSFLARLTAGSRAIFELVTTDYSCLSASPGHDRSPQG